LGKAGPRKRRRTRLLAIDKRTALGKRVDELRRLFTAALVDATGLQHDVKTSTVSMALATLKDMIVPRIAGAQRQIVGGNHSFDSQFRKAAGFALQ
jgi:hypothetical protein